MIAQYYFYLATVVIVDYAPLNCELRYCQTTAACQVQIKTKRDGGGDASGNDSCGVGRKSNICWRSKVKTNGTLGLEVGKLADRCNFLTNTFVENLS